MRELTLSAAGMPLVVRTDNGANRLRVNLGIQTGGACVLRWGIGRRPRSPWQCRPRDCWPAGTVAADATAVRTPFQRGKNGEQNLTIELDPPRGPQQLAFVLHLP